MRTDELMIGDFFLYKGNVVEIVSIDGGTGTVWIDSKKISALRKVDDLQPIPLTPKILEKNGFEKDPEDGTMCYENKELEEVTWRGTILKIDSLSASLELVSCMYVHQLQHALKLCSIGIEIRL